MKHKPSWNDCVVCFKPIGDQWRIIHDGAVCFECSKKLANKCPPHKWDEGGERCLNCGDKDWMT